MAEDLLGSYGPTEGEESMGGEAMPPVADAPMDDFTAAIQEAFPENDWSPERVDAMKEAIRICFEQDKAGGYGPGGGDADADEGLALVFGSPTKKKS